MSFYEKINNIIKKIKEYEIIIDIKLNITENLSEKDYNFIKNVLKEQINLYFDAIKREMCQKYNNTNLFNWIEYNNIADNEIEIKVNIDNFDTVLSVDDQTKILNIFEILKDLN